MNLPGEQSPDNARCNLLRDDGTESGSSNGLRFLADPHYFGPDVSPFSITIGPYHKTIGLPSLLRKITFDSLLILEESPLAQAR